MLAKTLHGRLGGAVTHPDQLYRVDHAQRQALIEISLVELKIFKIKMITTIFTEVFNAIFSSPIGAFYFINYISQ